MGSTKIMVAINKHTNNESDSEFYFFNDETQIITKFNFI